MADASQPSFEGESAPLQARPPQSEPPRPEEPAKAPARGALSKQRCFHHPAREAAARCPECAKSFCRECITEHDDRVICAACLRKATAQATRKRSRLGFLKTLGHFAAGLLTAWLFFYLAGQTLVKLPSAFHGSTIWSLMSEPHATYEEDEEDNEDEEDEGLEQDERQEEEEEEP